MARCKQTYPRVIIAGTHSGVGKTTITLGLLLAIRNRGLCVQPYKVGPDYIDAGFHSKISRRVCRNLDSFFLSRDVLLELFQRSSQSASISIIEGVMGMYDGSGTPENTGSTAHAARMLNAPVILVIDSGKMAVSAGAVALGYQKFDSRVNIAGCIINRAAGDFHYKIVKRSIEKAGVRVLGYLPKKLSFNLPERHLGLTPVQEINISKIYQKIAKVVDEFVDVDAVIKVANNAGALPEFRKTIFSQKYSGNKTSIAVARDDSFHFYYQDNLDILKHFGAELKFFSPLKSRSLPGGISGVYIGGGFPEMFAGQLAANESLRRDIKTKSSRGMPVYAECGGLMYLMRELKTDDKKIFPMVGIFPGRVRMGKGLRMFGYYDVRTVRSNIISDKGAVTKGHIFHWSYVNSMSKQIPFAFCLQRRGKIFYDGYMKDNTLAGYLHIHFGTDPSWAKKFVESCFEYRKRANNGE